VGVRIGLSRVSWKLSRTVLRGGATGNGGSPLDTGPKGKRQPLWIHRRAGGLLLFAGLYESWYPEKDRPALTFTIVTCAANAAIAAIHDRMPVVLDERAADDWMNPRERDPLSLKRLLVPAPHDLLAMRRAPPLVNSVKNEGPALLEFSEAATPDLFGSTRG
jgi:putative SOS response-associated peptidase YedK